MNAIRNWSEYNKALVNRGSLTVWFSPEVIEGWTDWKRPKNSTGRTGTYGDSAILVALMVRSLFRLPLRATEGFLSSLLKLMELNLPCPSFSTIGKRQKKLDVEIPSIRSNDAIDLVVDSTGLKVYGEGEWKVSKHGKGKRRVWRKLHLAVDPASHEVVVAEVSESGKHDSETAATMFDETDETVRNVYMDGAYDNVQSRKAVSGLGANAIIPPRSGAALIIPANESWEKERNKALKTSWKLGSKEEWKKASGYHRRSISETAMSRYKKIFGERMQSQTFKAQAREVFVKVRLMNQMCALGMPKR